MNNAIYDNMTRLAKSSYEAMKELYTVNNTFVEQMIEQQFALTSLAMEFTTSQMKLASTAKGYKEVVTAETDLVGDINSKLLGISRNTLDICNESRDEINAWFEKNMKEAEKGIKEVAKVVPISNKAA